MTGSGVWADLIAQRFAKARARLGFDWTLFRPPQRAGEARQATLF